jgi:glyoxylase I family protein
MPVTGIGGVFFRARDPNALTDWYTTHFGITMINYEPWQQQAGPTVFTPFADSTDHIPAGKQWMLNLRVDDLAATLAPLREAGIEVTTDPTWDSPETGKFARVHDPEGNAIELWQPPVE